MGVVESHIIEEYTTSATPELRYQLKNALHWSANQLRCNGLKTSQTDGCGNMAQGNNGNGNQSVIIVRAIVVTVAISILSIVVLTIFAPDNTSAIEKIILIAIPTATSLMAFLQSTRNSAKIDNVEKQITNGNGHDKEKK